MAVVEAVGELLEDAGVSPSPNGPTNFIPNDGRGVSVKGECAIEVGDDGALILDSPAQALSRRHHGRSRAEDVLPCAAGVGNAF